MRQTELDKLIRSVAEDSLRKASAENFTIDIEHGVAVARVQRRTELARDVPLLVLKARALILDDVAGFVLDVRRAPGAAIPAVEKGYGEILSAWEASGQPIAVLVGDPVQRMQLGQLVSDQAPRFGGLFSDREDARRFAGASGVNPSTAITSLFTDRPSRFRG